MVCIPRTCTASQELHSRPGPVGWISGSGRFVKTSFQHSAVSFQLQLEHQDHAIQTELKADSRQLTASERVSASKIGSAFLLPFVRTSYVLCRVRRARACLRLSTSCGVRC